MGHSCRAKYGGCLDERVPALVYDCPTVRGIGKDRSVVDRDRLHAK